MRWIAVAFAALVAVTGVVHAQPADVPALVKLIDTQPADMDRTTWKEKRRDAARRLGQSKDKRAVPTLIKLAESETFDIIGEIAMEGLGNLGDQSAVPVLQKIAADPAREKVQRDLAKKSLAKLGASATSGGAPTAGGTKPGGGTTADGGTKPAGGTTGDGGAKPGGGTTSDGGAKPGDGKTGDGGASDPGDGGTALGGSSADLGGGAAKTGAAGGALIGERSTALPELPALADDTIAAYERLTFAGGTASLAYDTARKRASFDVDVAGLYQRRVEREKLAYGWTGAAHVVNGFINPEGRAQTRGTQINVAGSGEARFYAGKLYGVGKAAAGMNLNYIVDVDPDDPANDLRDSRLAVDLQVAVGGGYGRLLDVGGAIRIRRLSRTLDAERALGKPIDDATARRLQLTWWALRGERSTYRALVSTVAILRESGILLGEPDAGLSYEILNVLRDSQLFLRPSGLDLQLAFGEGYLRRPGSIDDGSNTAGEAGRVEQALVSAGYGAQLADDKLELSGAAYARLRLFAPDDPVQPAPWAAGATARMRRFTYGDHGDPIGVFDLAADLRVSDDDEMDGELAARLGGSLGFTYWLNQASGIRLAATAAIDGGEVFIGAQLEATYGFLDVTFASP